MKISFWVKSRTWRKSRAEREALQESFGKLPLPRRSPCHQRAEGGREPDKDRGFQPSGEPDHRRSPAQCHQNVHFHLAEVLPGRVETCAVRAAGTGKDRDWFDGPGAVEVKGKAAAAHGTRGFCIFPTPRLFTLGDGCVTPCGLLPHAIEAQDACAAPLADGCRRGLHSQSWFNLLRSQPFSSHSSFWLLAGSNGARFARSQRRVAGSFIHVSDLFQPADLPTHPAAADVLGRAWMRPAAALRRGSGCRGPWRRRRFFSCWGRGLTKSRMCNRPGVRPMDATGRVPTGCSSTIP